MPKKRYSVIIVPDGTGRAFEKNVATWKMATGAALLVVFFIASIFFGIGFFKANIDNAKLASLKDENKYLESKIKTLQESIETVKGQMANIINRDENLRLIYDLPSIDQSIREVGIGGPYLGSREFGSPLIEKASMVEEDIDKILRQLDLENASFGDVFEQVKDKKDVLDHTPSIIPCEGFVTSALGMRKDPFTGMMVRHNGIDIATNKGTVVHAPASGRVINCGWDRGMGNFVVIDHGNNLKTYYGHLSLIKVNKGQYVERMDVLGLVGSTGRSTGPHLHYEVRKYEQPINPFDFFVKSIIYRS
jgi:murein DD-endopeptidase MepM/ murein hydrolase activator NlpD